jgi:hypothetical protein
MTALTEPAVFLARRPAALRTADAWRFRSTGLFLFLKLAIQNDGVVRTVAHRLVVPLSRKDDSACRTNLVFWGSRTAVRLYDHIDVFIVLKDGVVYIFFEGSEKALNPNVCRQRVSRVLYARDCGRSAGLHVTDVVCPPTRPNRTSSPARSPLLHYSLHLGPPLFRRKLS